MKKTLLHKTMLLLCALIVGSLSMWAQSDYSASYTGNITLSTTGGTSASACKVKISNTDYDGIKAGTGKAAGAVKISVPKDTKYLHLHVSAWNGESVTLAVTSTGYSSNIELTANTGISGSSTTYTFGTNSGDKAPNSTSHYKVITFTNALTANTDLTFTASSGNRFVVWGVYSEAASNDPSSEATFTNTAPSIYYPAQKTYSQEATTADGYTGTITYSITANTAGATINSSTGVVTVTQGGSVTVKAIAPAVSGSFSGSEASYTLTVNDTRTALGDKLAWSAASATVTYGADNNVFPTLTNTENVPVTYDSSNQAAATIDANTGAITLKDVKTNSTTTISAIFAGNDDYLAKTVEYTLNVNKAPFVIKDGVFDFVEAAAAGENYGSGISPTTDGQHYEDEDATWTAGNVTMITSLDTGNGYRWWSADGTLRFYNGSKATFSVPSGYVITKIVTTGANFDNADVGTLSGTTWTGASNEVTLSATATRSIKTITVSYTTATQPVTITATGYTTFSSNYPLDLSTLNGATAYVATEVTGGMVKLVNTTAKVPAGTGLFIKGTANENYTIGVTGDATTAPTSNLLVGAPNGTTVTKAANGQYNYVFGWIDTSNPGFYLINGTDATLPAGKAYLHTTSALNAPATTESRLGIILEDSEVTGIADINRETITKNGSFFDLQGRKVANPTKGLYIVNGCKVVIK